MAPPERPDGDEGPASGLSQPARPPRYGRYVGLLAIVILLFITLNTILTKPNGVGGIAVGEPLPPFAVPIANSAKTGDANVASDGPHPACSVRKPGVLNLCVLYEEGPVVLALFVEGGSCTDVLGEMESLRAVLPQGALRGGRDQGEARHDQRGDRQTGAHLPGGVG